MLSYTNRRREFAAHRLVLLCLQGDWMPLKKGRGKLDKLVKHFCPYFGSTKYFTKLVPEGFEE